MKQYSIWFATLAAFHLRASCCDAIHLQHDELAGFVLYGSAGMTKSWRNVVEKRQKTQLSYRSSDAFTGEGSRGLISSYGSSDLSVPNATTFNSIMLYENEKHYLKGSTVKSISSDAIFEDMELQPFKSPMIQIKAIRDQHHMRKDTGKRRSWKKLFDKKRDSGIAKLKKPWRRAFYPSSQVDPVSLLGLPEHLQRMDRDIRYMAVITASNIDDPEQLKELIENGAGVTPIVECIHDAANDIEMSSKGEDLLESDFLKSEDAFAIICLAVKTLRDLAAIDKNWSAVITDEILRIDDEWKRARGGGIFSDLVKILRYANKRPTRKRLDAMRRSGKGSGRNRFATRKQQRMAKKRCALYITQLLLSLAVASDEAISHLCDTDNLIDTVRLYSSYGRTEKLRRRLIRYPLEVVKQKIVRKKGYERPFLAAAAVSPGMKGQIQSVSNQLLAALGYNEFVPKVPGQKGLRILCLDGGGTRGIAAISIMQAMVDAMGGKEVCDTFDIIAGTSTGAIIAFLVGLRRESSQQAKSRYDELIEKIFVKSPLSMPMLFLTTASYSEAPFKKIMEEILGDYSMLNSRADPRVPLVFAVSSKMSSTTGKCCLFRNYNYSGGQAKPDKFVLKSRDARRKLGLKTEDVTRAASPSQQSKASGEGSRYEGSFRVLQRAALRCTTAAPTYFKPVQMGGEMYSDGGIVASNPTAIAIHEARRVYPNTPIELIVSCGTGEFRDEKISPSFGWDGIIPQIIKSATDTGRTHHILQDIFGADSTANTGSAGSMTNYFRFDPTIGTPTEYPIDGTDPKKLESLSQITAEYMREPEQQRSLAEISRILSGERKVSLFERSN